MFCQINKNVDMQPKLQVRPGSNMKSISYIDVVRKFKYMLATNVLDNIYLGGGVRGGGGQTSTHILLNTRST